MGAGELIYEALSNIAKKRKESRDFTFEVGKFLVERQLKQQERERQDREENLKILEAYKGIQSAMATKQITKLDAEGKPVTETGQDITTETGKALYDQLNKLKPGILPAFTTPGEKQGKIEGTQAGLAKKKEVSDAILGFSRAAEEFSNASSMLINDKNIKIGPAQLESARGKTGAYARYTPIGKALNSVFDLVVGGNIPSKTSPNQENFVERVARAQDAYSHAQTGANRGFKELSFLQSSNPNTDLPNKEVFVKATKTLIKDSFINVNRLLDHAESIGLDMSKERELAKNDFQRILGNTVDVNDVNNALNKLNNSQPLTDDDKEIITDYHFSTRKY